jgi:hypothetical protein
MPWNIDLAFSYYGQYVMAIRVDIIRPMTVLSDAPKDSRGTRSPCSGNALESAP